VEAEAEAEAEEVLSEQLSPPRPPTESLRNERARECPSAARALVTAAVSSSARRS